MSVNLGTSDYRLAASTEQFLARGIAGHVIDGAVRPSSSGETLDVFNPTTGEVITQVADGSQADVDLAVSTARRAFEDGRWSRKHPAEREAVLRRLATLLQENSGELGDLDSIDAGMLRKYGEFIQAYVQSAVNYYAGWPTKMHGLVAPSGAGDNINIRKEPIGVFAHILPWNAPTAAMASVAAALAAGNSVVLKPAEQSPLAAVRLGEIALEAGIPDGVFNVLQGSGARTGAWLTEHPGIDGIHFTGSTVTGKAIAHVAADRMKRISMELGGKSPFIVFNDADLDAAVPSALVGAWNNAGQVCTAGARVFVQRGIYDDFMARAADQAKSWTVGSPFDTAAAMGPIVSERQHQSVARYFELGLSEGVDEVWVGETPALNGYFHAPRIWAGVRNDMRIAQEEIFGPILAVIPFDSEEEVIAQANDIEYGLAAGVWTQDITRAYRVERQLHVGTVWINTYMRNEVAAPFGGVKQSGYGRNLGMQSLENYVQTKTVWVGGL